MGTLQDIIKQNDAIDQTPGEVLASASVASFVEKLALGVAKAQTALDLNGVAMVKALAETPVIFDDGQGNQAKHSALSLGFAPAFYHFQEVSLDLKMTVSLRVERALGLDVEVSRAVGDPAEEAATAWARVTVVMRPSEVPASVTFAVEDHAAKPPTHTDFTFSKESPYEIGGAKQRLADLKDSDDTPAATASWFLAFLQSQASFPLDVSAEGAVLTLRAKAPGIAGNSLHFGKINVKLFAEMGGADGSDLSLSGGRDARPRSSAPAGAKGLSALGSSVDLHAARRFNYDISGSSEIKVKMISVEPPSVLMQAVRRFYGLETA